MNNFYDLFGWRFRNKGAEEVNNIEVENILAPYITPENDDATFVMGGGVDGSGAVYIKNLDLGASFQNENDLIRVYRDTSLNPEVDAAVTDIVNEAINGDNDSCPVEIVLDDLKASDSIKKVIREEFDHIMELLKFNTESYEIFRKWYVDGRLNYHIILDENHKANGIKELRYISPLHIKKVREEVKKRKNNIDVIDYISEYYVYSPAPFNGGTQQAIKLSKESICYVTSGLIDEQKNLVYSHLHKAIKPANQLSMMENALVIYRLSRAPERRIFYVDTGNLPTKKQEEYLRNVMARFKNKMSYDTLTGEMKDQKNVMSMLEDIWLPRSGNGKSTEVSTLPGGQSLGQIDDVDYFKRKQYLALNVPIGRIATMENASGFSIGKASEISREEVKFAKFISRLRKRFSKLFYELLRTQLILKGKIKPSEWKDIENSITFDFISDNYFQELKEFEILRERIAMLNEVKEFVGEYYSKDFVRKEILKMSDEDIEQQAKLMQDEAAEQEPEPNEEGEESFDGDDGTVEGDMDNIETA